MSQTTNPNPDPQAPIRHPWVEKFLPWIVILGVLGTIAFIFFFPHEVREETVRIAFIGGSYLAVVGVVLVTMYVPWLNRRTPHDDEYHIEILGSETLGLQRRGLILGFALGVAGGLFTTDKYSFWIRLAFCLVDSLLVMTVMVIGTKTTDAFLLCRIDNLVELVGGNMAVARAEYSCYVGRGIILFAAFAGADRSPLEGFLNALLFAALGEATFALAYLALDLFIPTDYEKEIQNGNEAAGLEVGDFLLSLAIVLASAIIGPFTGWGRDVVSYLVAVVPTTAMLMAAVILADIFMLRRIKLGTKIHHQKLGVSLTTGAVMRGAAVLLAGAVVGQYVVFTA